jgi:hypothetical protein
MTRLNPEMNTTAEQDEAQTAPEPTTVVTFMRFSIGTISRASATEPPGLSRNKRLLPDASSCAKAIAALNRCASPATISPLALTPWDPSTVLTMVKVMADACCAASMPDRSSAKMPGRRTGHYLATSTKFSRVFARRAS